MKKKNKFFGSILLTTITCSAILISSCTKDELNDINVDGTENNKKISGILSFNSQEDYLKSIQHLSSMSPEERIVWEEAQGFTSFATASEEIYSSINPEGFTSIEEVKEFIAKNSDHLVLLEDENGELTLETRLHDSPERYILNKERMYKIGGEVHKVFDDYIAYTGVDNYKTLKDIKEGHVKAGDINPIISLKAASTSMKTKSESGGIQQSPTPDNSLPVISNSFKTTSYSSDGKNRTDFEIVKYEVHTTGNDGVTYTKYGIYTKITPYKKFLRVWYNDQRTISYDLKIAYEIWNAGDNEWESRIYKYTAPGLLRKSIKHTVVGGYFPGIDNTIRLNGLDCWADTPSTAHAHIEINKHLF